MTKNEVIKSFIDWSEDGYNDYYEMQQSWTYFTDMLARDGDITVEQFDSWLNPTTPEKFKAWHKKNFGTEHK